MAERLATLPLGLAPPKPPAEREIVGERALLTWVSSFATYIAIVAEAHPEWVADMLAYMRLVIREASKFGGTGWLTYDSVFCRSQEGLSTLWNTLDAALHQVYIASQGTRTAPPCQHCLKVDHLASECAVAALLPSTSNGTHPQLATQERMAGKAKRPSPYTTQRPVCASWNAGTCKFPGKCLYSHVCTNCYGSHPATSCRERPFTPSSATRPSSSTAKRD